MTDAYTTNTDKYSITTLEGTGLDDYPVLEGLAEAHAWSNTVWGKIGKTIGDDRVPEAVLIKDKQGNNNFLAGKKQFGDSEDLIATDFVKDTGKQNDAGEEIFDQYRISNGFTVKFNREDDPAKRLVKGAVTPESAAAIEKLTNSLSKLPPGIYKVDDKGVPTHVDEKGNVIKAEQVTPPQQVTPTPPPQHKEEEPHGYPVPHKDDHVYANALEKYHNSTAPTSEQPDKLIALSTPKVLSGNTRNLS